MLLPLHTIMTKNKWNLFTVVIIQLRETGRCLILLVQHASHNNGGNMQHPACQLSQLNPSGDLYITPTNQLSPINAPHHSHH